MYHPFHFTLILATLGRKEPLFSLFESLVVQTYKNFTVLVIDQNSPGFLAPVFEKYQSQLDISVVRSLPGLSKARNVGLKNSKGDAFALTDDDSIYAPDTLEMAAEALQNADVVIGTLLPPNQLGFASLKGKRVIGQESSQETLLSVFRSAPSATLFFRSSAVDEIGLFDEALGVGSGTIFASGEETDYLIRCVRAGHTIVRAPEVRVYHPVPDFAASADKARSYGRGRNYVILKHKLGFTFLLCNACHALFMCMSSIPRIDRVRWYWNMFLGRMGF